SAPHSRRTGLSQAVSAAELSHQLRCESGAFLAQRRGILVLSLLATGAMGLIALYQMGVIKHLPEPPLPRLDADTIDASPEAYERLSTPDATLGAASYATTMVLAAMGSKDRARRQPWIPLALAGKVTFDVLQALRMTRVQWTKYRAFCFWCLVSAAATFASAPLVFGETREALRRLAKGAEKGNV
ncbi:MAG TPA: vitamin K epoxide reductase family protein, partial [Candidatus Sulfotelmatobacter sp.]|nr:vitamin K epoxide reductase family protein [Candidatus Sulfotelmatobacter sp.]